MTKPGTVYTARSSHKSKALVRVPATESKSVGDSHLVKGLVLKALLTIKAHQITRICQQNENLKVVFYTKYTILLQPLQMRTLCLTRLHNPVLHMIIIDTGPDGDTVWSWDSLTDAITFFNTTMDKLKPETAGRTDRVAARLTVKSQTSSRASQAEI